MAQPSTVPVTVVIAARNESENIAACIDSVRWAAEVIVAEQGSTDDTIVSARAAGATVHSGEEPTIGMQRNAAIARAANPWIFVIDADERATPAVRDAILETISVAAHDAYRIPRRNFFLGQEIRHGGWDRDRPVRLFRDHFRYNDSHVHEHVVTRGTVGVLPAALLHVPYRSLDHYFDKFDRYSRWWATQQAERGRRTSAAAVLYKPPARFVKMYLMQLGLLDGAPGLVLACLAAASVLAKHARLWGAQHEVQRTRDDERTGDQTEGDARPCVS